MIIDNKQKSSSATASCWVEPLRNASAHLVGLALAGCALDTAQANAAPHQCLATQDAGSISHAELPQGFSYIRAKVPNLRVELRYAGSNNFTGRPVPGYRGKEAIATDAAVRALGGVQRRAERLGLGLLVYDAYRPQQAVDAFIAWAADTDDNSAQLQYYPSVPKNRIFAEGYIAAKSGHSRGSTIDLTLVTLPNGTPIDMGSAFDLFDPISHTDAPNLSLVIRRNRDLLRELMRLEGFVNLPQEWWHYTLKDEPFPDTYFDFPVQ